MTTIPSSETELRKVLTLFKGQTCWNVSSGGIGSSLRLFFGKAIETVVRYPIENPPARNFGGQYELTFVCSWRLDDENYNTFLSGLWSEYHDIKTTTISLIGDSIESIEIIPPLWEATVRFSSGRHLRTFCDSIPGSMANWWCTTEEEAYYIGPGNEIDKAERRRHLVSTTLYDPEEIDPEFIISDKDYKPKEVEEQEPDDQT